MTTSHFSYKSYEHQPNGAPPKPEDDDKLYRKKFEDVIKFIEGDDDSAKNKAKAKLKTTPGEVAPEAET